MVENLPAMVVTDESFGRLGILPSRNVSEADSECPSSRSVYMNAETTSVSSSRLRLLVGPERRIVHVVRLMLPRRHNLAVQQAHLPRHLGDQDRS